MVEKNNVDDPVKKLILSEFRKQVETMALENKTISTKDRCDIMRREFQRCVYELLKESNEETMRGYAKLVCMYYNNLIDHGMHPDFAALVAANFNFTNMYMPFAN